MFYLSYGELRLGRTTEASYWVDKVLKKKREMKDFPYLVAKGSQAGSLQPGCRLSQDSHQ